MEDNKKNAPRHEGGENRNGQRISVRPGNFNPPAPQGERKENNERRPNDRRNNGEGRANDGDRRNNRHHKNHHRGNRPEHRPQGNTETATTAPQAAEKAENGGKHPDNNRQGGNRHGRNNRRGNDRRDHQRPTEEAHRNDGQPHNDADRRHEQRRGNDRREEIKAPKAPATETISDSLQKALDEEFGTPTLGTTFGSSLLRKDKKQEELAVSSDEFAVDIATAAYLLEDIPCGFPIPDGKAVEVVGVRFRHAGKVYFFAPENKTYRIGDEVLVDTARGPELGEIVMLKRKIAEKDVIQPLRSVLRHATPEDKAHEQENRRREAEALKICADKIAYHKLDMRLVDAQYTFDNSKLLFYFTSEGRVDFRELVRDLAGVFHTRIELRQIGIRDESRLIGGLGMCGRPFCCSTFLSDFGQVSIKMAKEQGLSINTSKISGCCGRLMCCLRYEHETYQLEAQLTPKKDTLVSTPDGNGVVVDATPLAGTVKVKLDAAPEEEPKLYHRDDVTPIRRESSPAKPVEPPRNMTENAEEKAGETIVEQAGN